MASDNDKITESTFKKLSLPKKYKVAEEKGYFIAQRTYRGMEAYLYKVEDFYIEIWKRFMINEIAWIEVAPESVIDKYADSVDLKKLLPKD